MTMWGEVLLFGASALAVVCAGAVVESILHAEDAEIQLRRLTARRGPATVAVPAVPSYSLLWVMWAALFMGIEIPAALDRKPGGTLSEKIWRLASVNTKARLWRFRRLALLTALLWASVHLVTGWV